MLLFPLGCAIIGFLSWQKLRPSASGEENGGKLLRSGLVNSGLLKSIISLLCISQLAKFVNWAENKIPREAKPDRRKSTESDSFEALECDNDHNHLDVLFWFNPLASMFADDSAYSSADDDEEEPEAEAFTETDNWVCEAESSGSLERRFNIRICEELDHMVGTTVRGRLDFHDQLVRESEMKTDVSPSVLWCDMQWIQREIAETVESNSSNTISPRHKFQRRSCAIRAPYVVSKELKSEEIEYSFGSNNVDVGAQNPSKGAGNKGVKCHGAEERTWARTDDVAKAMDRERPGYSDAQRYYSRNKRKQKGKVCVVEAEESSGFKAEASYDDEVNRSLPYMRELEAVWRKLSDGGLRKGQRDRHEQGQFSELLDFWRHVEQVSPQHTYTPPTSAPVSPSNSSSSCNSPH